MAAPAPGGTTPRTTGFGNTIFDVAVPAQAPHRGPESAFDVCHVGVVLRALVFVHGVMAIGMVFGATGFASWTTLTAAGASVALPAVLLWLLVVCGLKAQLARCGVGGGDNGFDPGVDDLYGPDSTLFFGNYDLGDRYVAYGVAATGRYVVVVMMSDARIGAPDVTLLNGLTNQAVVRVRT